MTSEGQREGVATLWNCPLVQSDHAPSPGHDHFYAPYHSARHTVWENEQGLMGIEVFALSSFERLVWLAVWGQLGVLPKGLALLRHYTCLSPPPFSLLHTLSNPWGLESLKRKTFSFSWRLWCTIAKTTLSISALEKNPSPRHQRALRTRTEMGVRVGG